MVKLVFSNFISSFLFQLLITVRCVITQLLFDADKLVVLSHTVSTTHRTCLNLTRVCCYGNDTLFQKLDLLSSSMSHSQRNTEDGIGTQV